MLDKYYDEGDNSYAEQANDYEFKHFHSGSKLNH